MIHDGPLWCQKWWCEKHVFEKSKVHKTLPFSFKVFAPCYVFRPCFHQVPTPKMVENGSKIGDFRGSKTDPFGGTPLGPLFRPFFRPSGGGGHGPIMV